MLGKENCPSAWGTEFSPGAHREQVPFVHQLALALLQRFVHDGRESDKVPTRDRLKLLARIVNVDQWAVSGPLSGYVSDLLCYAHHFAPSLCELYHLSSMGSAARARHMNMQICGAAGRTAAQVQR